MKTTTLFLLCLAWSLVHAQTVTSSFFPSPNTTITTIDADNTNVFAGSSGTGQTWYFGALATLDTIKTNYISPAQAPVPDSFPGATVVSVEVSLNSNNGLYDYFTVTPGSVSDIGLYQGISTFRYAHSQNFTHFPLTYGATFIDSTYNFYGGGSVFYLEIDSTVVDGSGTLTTPAGTFTDVLRLKTLHYYWDSMVQHNPPLITETFKWVKEGIKGPLFTITADTNGYVDRAIYQTNITTGIASPKLECELSVWPNPAQTSVVVDGLPKEIATGEYLLLYNSLGEIVGKYEVKGTERMELQLTHYVNGLYFLRLSAIDLSFTPQRLVILR